jgi:hypothetical protein
LLDFIYSKKVVLLILSARKKWGSTYNQPNNGGKKWEEMVEPVMGNMGERDCPLSEPLLTI